jgi:hypothetical protein
MQDEHLKTAIAGTWVLGVGAAALALGVSSATTWMAVVGFGLLPPVMLFRMWRQPPQTISESIHEVLQ